MSVYYDILTSVRSTLAALAGFSGVTVAVRKIPFYSPDHDSSLPFVCVSPQAERIAQTQFSNDIWFDYPVIVAIYQAKGATVQSVTQLQWQLDRREDVRKALHITSLGGAGTVFDSDYNPNPAFDISAQHNLFDISLQQFTFRSDETRTS